MILTRLCVVLVLGFVSIAQAAEPVMRQFGNLIYTMPQDFKKGRSEPGYVILYTDSKKLDVYANIQLYSGTDKAAVQGKTLSDWALAFIQADIEKDDKVVRQPESKVVKMGELPALMISRAIAHRGKEMQVYVAMELPTRYELIRFEGPISDKEDLTKTTAVLKTHFVPMLTNLRYVSMGAKPVLGDPKPGSLQGVWWGGGLQSSIGIDGMMRMDFAQGTYTFFKDGRFYAGIPEEGIKSFNFAREVMRDTGAVGNYYVEGKKIRLRYADGEVDEVDYDGSTIVDGVKHLTQCRVPPDGFRFAGTRSFVYYQGFTPGVMQGGVSAYNSTTFRKDGTFDHSGGAGSSASFEAGGGFATQSKNAAAGTYRVKDGFVELVDRDGKMVKRWTILLSDGKEDGKAKTWILVNGDFVK